MIRSLLMLIVVVTIGVFGVASYYFYPDLFDRQFEKIGQIEMPNVAIDLSFIDDGVEAVGVAYGGVLEELNDGYQSIVSFSYDVGGAVMSVPYMVSMSATNIYNDASEFANGQFINAKQLIAALFKSEALRLDNSSNWPQLASNEFYQNDASPNDIDILAGLEPSSGSVDPPPGFDFEYEIEETELTAEAVLVPRSKTVISSSRDGKIKTINFKNGDHFKKGDVILEYHCDDLRAELNAVRAEKKFAGQKQLTTSRLFNMELSSTLEVSQSKVENEQAMAKAKLVEQRIKDCTIRADYDGRVVKKLANDNEYTRTDRVLLEVASKGTLDVEFLLPSRALRWVNVDAPISLVINETEREYNGKIKQIYGEVDPVSQSIQIRASLDGYDQPLLPGMSGQITVDIPKIREAGIAGFLETQTQ